MTNIYDKQRLDGARLIIDKAIELAKSKEITFQITEWDHGQAISHKAEHTLSLTAKEKTVSGKFPDEWLVDYPGRVGTEKANARLSEMINQLG